MEEMQGDLITSESLKKDFESLGIKPGMTVIMHSSMKSLGGWIAGGPVALILALEQCLGENGTLVMPTHTPDLSDPASWRLPPVKESWWNPIRETMPAFDEDLIPCEGMGKIADCFRKQTGVIRSSHPQVSFAAWGSRKAAIIRNHSLTYALGENSPLARLYEADGYVLLLGVSHRNNTSIHLAEYRAAYKGKAVVVNKAPVYINGEKQWVDFVDIDIDPDDFNLIGDAFERDTNHIRRGKIANADALLMPIQPLVDYAAVWLEANRK
ncbi:aminoglycoside 3-N-acetyltransferase [Paenibacillus castaneae]|uniref:aminoglycoside N(3)-acetyltransferase n=1 Tax=Paenibacillus castaneae TaxID=474957 RepID=UPI000C9CA0E2|nr:AAC(3) family N-acetyltransferase [Paenibacillus castaneae]NIK78942.1 aminoglycoside 3-N-acetyltransferase [Paenibacillus castaneae]